MQTQELVVDRAQARELWRTYRQHQHYSKPIDWEVQRAYQLLAQGRLLIRAIGSIVAAGLNAEHLPKLAIVRADAAECFWRPDQRGGGVFSGSNKYKWRANTAKHEIAIPPGTWPSTAAHWSHRAVTPLIPLPLRPKRALQAYHILFEAEWSRAVPLDPMLLRRVGEADMWLVVAAWDLSPVEQAALAARIRA
jgi:hypothetical protein